MRGDALVLPPVEDRMVSFLRISPDGKQVAVVLGNMTQQSLYVARFPARKPSEYRLVAEFDNCYKLDGVNWNPADPTQLSCKVSQIQSSRKLPGLTTQQEWRTLIRDKRIEEKDFASSLYVLSTEGKPSSRICALTPSLSPSNTADTAWAADEVIFCSERDRIERCSIGSKKATTVYYATRDAKVEKGIQGLAWNPNQQELVALQYVRKGTSAALATAYFDSAGKVLRDDVPVPSATNAEDLTFFRMDARGESFVVVKGVASAAPKALWGRVDSEKTTEFSVPSGESFVPACVSTSGVAVLIFPNPRIQRARFEEPEEMRVPSLNDFSFRVVSLA